MGSLRKWISKLDRRVLAGFSLFFVIAILFAGRRSLSVEGSYRLVEPTRPDQAEVELRFFVGSTNNQQEVSIKPADIKLTKSENVVHFAVEGHYFRWRHTDTVQIRFVGPGKLSLDSFPIPLEAGTTRVPDTVIDNRAKQEEPSP